ncbi:helix-turn-helix transcriptional regulator [bacterium]|nr:helix-turn-helix transcriptional regulator [bacterium]
MKNLKEAFGAKIKELRKQRGLTQEELAEMIDINQRQLTRIEKGENFPSAETLAKFSTSLNVELSTIFDIEWNQEITLMATGTDATPFIRLVQKNEQVKIVTSEEHIKEMDIPKQIDVASTEEIIQKISQNMQKPLMVEYFDDKTRKYVKTYHPNGQIDVKISEKNVQSENIQSYVKEKMKNYSEEIEKLEFVKLAVDALSDPQAANELKIMLRGIELAQGHSRR